MIGLAYLTGEQSPELALAALRRAVLCEQLAGMGQLCADADALFLAGLFSLLDDILDRSAVAGHGQRDTAAASRIVINRIFEIIAMVSSLFGFPGRGLPHIQAAKRRLPHNWYR